MRVYRLLTVALLSILVFLGVSTVHANLNQDADEGEYFPRYGHWVQGEFLTLYHSVNDPSRLFGDPITPVFADPMRPGIEIQYFERVRMDYDPNKPVGQRVNLANLGEFLFSNDPSGKSAGYSTFTNMCRQVVANTPPVCYAFLQLYDGNNGAVVFGKPISEALIEEDGRIVQYFERARMEWRTEMPVGERVVLTELGQIDFDRRIANPDLLRAEPSNSISFIEPRVYAFTNHPLIANDQAQQIYVLVTDQYDHPLAGVQVQITIQYPDTHVDSHPIKELTNADGVTQEEFVVSGLDPNQVVNISVEASFSSGQKGIAQTWFRTWW